MEKKEQIEKLLMEVYLMLRNEGFYSHSIIIKELLFYVYSDEYILFKRKFFEANFAGGAGSVLDIDFRNKSKNEIFFHQLEEIKTHVDLML